MRILIIEILSSIAFTLLVCGGLLVVIILWALTMPLKRRKGKRDGM